MNLEIQILVLEDSPADVAKIEAALQKGGLQFRLQRADTEETFLRELKMPPDVILSDHGLPAFNGLAALATARRICPDVPFIFVTNALSREMEIEKLTGGLTDYVRKSQLDYLAVAVRHALHEAEEWRGRKRRLNEFFDQPSPGKVDLIPICSNCKRIRNDRNQWKPLEVFFLEYLNLKFTHGLCPDCAEKFLADS